MHTSLETPGRGRPGVVYTSMAHSRRPGLATGAGERTMRGITSPRGSYSTTARHRRHGIAIMITPTSQDDTTQSFVLTRQTRQQAASFRGAFPKQHVRVIHPRVGRKAQQNCSRVIPPHLW
eukprot:362785-Chlamydomonas_euryale.AAC.2